MSEEPQAIIVAEDSFKIVKELGELPPGAIVTIGALANMFDRCTESVKRAVEGGKLPPPVKLFGKRIWTARAILDHIEVRLEAAKLEAEKENARIARLSP